jgi:Ribbon-helix-helix protein, copG family
MISARLDPILAAALMQLAEKRGMSLSDVLRVATLLLLRREEAQNVITFSVSAANERTGGVAHESFRQDIEVPL